MWWSKEVVRVSSSRRWRRHCTGNILLASLFPSFGDTFPVMQTVDVNNNLARRRIRIHTGYGITQDPQDPAPQVFLLLNSILLFTEGKRYAFTSPQQILYFVANCWMDWMERFGSCKLNLMFNPPTTHPNHPKIAPNKKLWQFRSDLDEIWWGSVI